MPHISIEYSANLAPRIDVQALVDQVHASALASDLFQLGAVRTRAVERSCYRIADGAPDNAFVSIVVRIGSGRELALRQRLGERVFATASSFLDPLFDTIGLGLSLEVQEIDPHTAFRRNSLHERMAASHPHTSRS